MFSSLPPDHIDCAVSSMCKFNAVSTRREVETDASYDRETQVSSNLSGQSRGHKKTSRLSVNNHHR
jgi:hypothetical protein